MEEVATGGRAPGAAAAEDDHRADALFALARLPRRVAVSGSLPEWRDALAARGIEAVGLDEDAEVAVASAADVDAALAGGAPTVVVDGPPRAAAAVEASGRAVRRLLPLPLHGAPSLYADLSGGAAVRYAFQRVIAHGERWRTLRNTAVGTLAAVGLAPPFPRVITVGSRDGGPPAFVSAAREQLEIPQTDGWLMVVSPGPAVRRNALLLFPPRGRVPAIAIKHSRVRGMTEPFDRERRGYEALSGLDVVAARAPRPLGEVEVDGYLAAVESAAHGARLSSLLRQGRREAVKLEAIDAVAAWLVEVGRGTVLPPEALAEERERLWRELERSPFSGRLGPGRLERLARVPATLQHNDLGADNVIAEGAEFTVVDWEWAQRAGFPLGDLVLFAVRTLAIVHGATHERDVFFADLLRGEAPGSGRFFRWLRALVDALGLEPGAVAPALEASLLRGAVVSLRERDRAERAVGRALEPDFQVRIAERWLEEPGLGDAWRAWQG